MSDETSAPLPPHLRRPPVAEARPFTVNLILLVLCSLLGVWLLLGEPATQTTFQAGTRKNFVLPFFQAEEIVGIELIRGKERVLLKRPRSGNTTGQRGLPTSDWSMDSPLKDRADDTEVNKLLNGIQHLRIEGRISAEEAESYAFGEVLGKLSFFREGKPAFALTVGAPRPGAVVPVRDERDGAIYHVKEELKEHVQRPLWMLRDKNLMVIKPEDVTRVAIETTGAAGPGDTTAKVGLLLEQGRWRVGGKRGQHAARGLVDEVIQGAAYFQATGIAKDDPTPAELRTLGLNPPRMRLTLQTAGGGQKATLDVGKALGNGTQERYLRIPSRPLTVYTGDVSKLYATMQRAPEDYLDPSLIPLEGGEGTITSLRATFLDGDDLNLKRVEKDWTFASSGPVLLAKNKEVDELAKRLLSLTILERLGSVEKPEHGLKEADLRLWLAQGDVEVSLTVGANVEGRPGVHVVRMEDGEARFVYVVDLGDVPMRLRDGPLELRHPRMFRVSHHDLFGVRLYDETGKLTFSAEKRDPSKGQHTNPLPKWFVAGEELGTDHQRMVAFLKRFEDLQVERWVALDGDEARSDYGLRPHPRRLVFETRTLNSQRDLVSEERTILLGERIGERIHAYAEGGPPAIGLVDASFLDRLTKGFTSETKLFGFAWYDIVGVKVFQGGAQTASFERTDKNWLRDGKQVIGDPTDMEDEVLKPFGELVGVTRTETSTPERRAERGLAPPAVRIEFTVRTVSGTGPNKTYELHIGNGEGLPERSRWATAPGNDALGAWYDGPLRQLQDYLQANPGPK